MARYYSGVAGVLTYPDVVPLSVQTELERLIDERLRTLTEANVIDTVRGPRAGDDGPLDHAARYRELSVCVPAVRRLRSRWTIGTDERPAVRGS